MNRPTSTPILAAVRAMHEQDDGRDPRNHTPRPRYPRPERDVFAATTDQLNAADAYLRDSTLNLEE